MLAAGDPADRRCRAVPGRDRDVRGRPAARDLAQHLVHRRGPRRRVGAAWRAERNAPRSTAPEAGRGRAPRPSVSAMPIQAQSSVLGVVEPVAADVVAGQDVAGDQRAADPQDPRRQQVLLDLGRGRRRAHAAHGGDRVGVLVGQRDRRRGLGREVAQRVVAGADRQQHARSRGRAGTSARRRCRAAASSIAARSGSMPSRGISGPTASGTGIRVGNAAAAGHPLERRAVEVAEVDGRRRSRRRGAAPRRRSGRRAGTAGPC